MNYRIILFIICSLFLSSCTENEPSKVDGDVSHAKAEHKSDSQVKARSPIEAPAEDVPAINMEDFNIEEEDFVLGNRNAKVILMEYSSLTCPHCSFFHKEILPKLKEKYMDTGKIAYVLREFVANKQDLDASIMGRCYEDVEDPLKLLNLLYIQQDSWAFSKNYREIIMNLGGLAGVSREKYIECLSDKPTIEFLLKQAKIITSYPGFIGTPAFLVNGMMHKGSYSMEVLSKAIDAKLKEVETEGESEKAK